MKYDFLLFDMDGMLVDTREGILKCAAHALCAFGIEVEDLSSLTKFVGPPLSYSFTEFYGLSPEDAKKAVAIYRGRYSAKGQYECYVFDGVPEMLQALLKKGYRLCIATSKLESYAKAMLDRLGIGCYFEQVIGATPDEAISTKDEVIEASLVRMGITDRQRALMIGDSGYGDADAANHVVTIKNGQFNNFGYIKGEFTLDDEKLNIWIII